MQGDGAGLVKAWRVEEAAGAAQVHLDLAHAGVVRRTVPAAARRRGERLPLRHRRHRPAARRLWPPPAATNPTQIASIQPGKSAPEQELHAAKGSRRARQIAQLAKIEAPVAPLTPSRKVIVIDAGHGGHDPGAFGSDAPREGT